jgi:DNA invertase Pin-like site-specific DNA recombinase
VWKWSTSVAGTVVSGKETSKAADTTTAHGRLMLTVLGGLAEFERELIRTRTGEGRQRAKARGVIMGRKPKLTGHQRREALARREAGEAPIATKIEGGQI